MDWKWNLAVVDSTGDLANHANARPAQNLEMTVHRTTYNSKDGDFYQKNFLLK